MQVTRIDGTIDSPPCLKVTHKTFGTQNSNANMVFCRLSMPVEFHPTFRSSPSIDINGVLEDESQKPKHRCEFPTPSHSELLEVTEILDLSSCYIASTFYIIILAISARKLCFLIILVCRHAGKAQKHQEDGRRTDYSSITMVCKNNVVISV